MMNDGKNIVWPGWETLGLIGRGSFGSVYEIQRDVLGDVEKAALKVISIPQNASDIDTMYSESYDEESITETFRNYLKNIVSEYTTMRKFSDCVTIVSCDDVRYVRHEDGIGWDIFIKMELLTPLTKALPTQIPEETVVKLAKDICAALVVCEKHSLIHRDIKPQNIFVSASGIYKLGDFGIAKTVEKTMGGTKIGTYKYMAPEVYNNQPYGHSADIYSLGLVLYWLLNERRGPFLPIPPVRISAEMDEKAQLRRFSGETLPPPVHGNERLKRIVLKACAFDPKKRYSSAAQFLKELSDFAEIRTDIGAVVSERNDADTDDAFTVGLFSQTEHQIQEAEDKTADIGSVLHTTAGEYRKPQKANELLASGADEYEKTVGLFSEKRRATSAAASEKNGKAPERADRAEAPG